MKSINRKDFIVAGTVAKTHGTRGELKITTEIQVKLTGWAFLEIREKPVPFYISQAVQAAPDEWILKLEGIATVEEARAYTGHAFLVPRKSRAKRRPAEPGFDLNGFLLVDDAAGEIGEIVATEQLPQQTMMITHYKGREIMIPLVEEFIKEVDEEKEIIYLGLPEGFFDLYE